MHYVAHRLRQIVWNSSARQLHNNQRVARHILRRTPLNLLNRAIGMSCASLALHAFHNRDIANVSIKR